MARFIRFPWATTGDKVEPPFPTDPGGAASYSQGFGPNYELPNTNPNYEPVPRDLTNGLYFDITDNIRQYQLNGAPEWHPATDNGGVAISYPINAIVRWNDLVYRSLIANNTVEPGTDATKWAVSGVAQQATTAVTGITRYATTAEAAARSIATAAVTPAGLGALFDLLLNQPIFPEVNTTDGLFTVTSPSAGTVRIAAGTTWTHRGAFTYTSELTDLSTLANKTYHLRWGRVNGFALYDLSSGTYNPSALAETDPSFDTTYDDMLFARVVTNGSNVATITRLANRARLALSQRTTGTITDSGFGSRTLSTTLSLNWSRTPSQRAIAGNVRSGAPSPGGSLDGYAGYLDAQAATRYTASATVSTDWDTGATLGSLAAYIDYALGA